MKARILHLIIFYSISLVGCQQAEIISKEYPYVVMQSADISGEGVTFKAKLDIGQTAISSYGFVWGIEASPEIEHQRSQVLSDSPATGEYSLTVQSGLIKDTTYFVRPFVVTESYKVYGNEISFLSKGSLAPQIKGISPKSGEMGTEVEISGTNFGNFKNDLVVNFVETDTSKSYTAEILSVTDEKLIVKVPQIIGRSELAVSVETAGMVSFAQQKFNYNYDWRRTVIPHEIYETSAHFTYNGQLYIINPYSSTLLIYNLSQNSWTETSLPVKAGRYPLAVAVGSKAYLLFGKYFYELDLLQNTWTLKSVSIDPNEYHIKREFAKMFSVDNEVFIINYDFESYFENHKVWHYSPTNNRWIRKSDFPAISGNPWQVYTFTVNSKIYTELLLNSQNILWEYNPSTDQWKQKTSSPYSSNYFQNNNAFTFNNQVYLMRENEYNGNRQIYVYDPIEDSWKDFSEISLSLELITSFSHDNKGYFIAFVKRDSDQEIWEYTPEIEP
jgi:hypothetical protein